MTYGELNQRSDQLAQYLINKGFKPKEFAAIFLKRSFDMLVSIFAVLKAGGTYVPIDIDYPEERIKYIIEHSNSKFFITKDKLNSLKKNKKFNTCQIICLDKNFKTIKALEPNFLKNKLNSIDSNYFAYLIYTSGSTGTPKGVLITHRNVMNYAHWFSNLFKLKRNSVVDFSSSIGFDLSVACTLVPLLTGAQVAICTKLEKLDPVRYLKHLKENHVTHIECTPDYFNHLLAFPNEIKDLKKLKWIMLGGDAVIKKDLVRWLKLRPKDKLANEYGPTECTVAITAHIVNKNNIDDYGNIIPIGKPAFNTQAYVLDTYNNLCPIGIPGELCIAGDSVAAGYLNHENTKHKFVPNPFLPESKMYKTGDLVRLLADGNLEFIGRKDDQIKIRGFRIELREIEDCLLEFSRIIQCKVIAQVKNNGEKYLIAYLIPKKNTSLEIVHIRDFISKFLPDYMIPERFIILDYFPTSNSGKIDLQALSQIKENYREHNPVITGPINKTMQTLLNIWSKVFEIKQISPDSDFFELGGHSLTALKLINEIQNTFAIRLPVQLLFNYTTVSKLHILIDNMFKSKNNNSNFLDIKKDPQIICLQARGKKSPLVLIPPVGGTIFIYKNLVKHLCKDFPVYGLQDAGIENPDINYNTLEEMACYYVKAIQSIQNKGPYLLAGSSFGATLAIEITNQLNALGECVPFIGLFDGWTTYSNKLNDQIFFQKFMRQKLEDVDAKLAEAILSMQYQREKLLFKYKIPKLNEQITLFKAEELWPIFVEMDKKLDANGWQPYSHKPLQTFSIPGDHETMFYMPHVKKLAKQMNICLHDILEEED